MFKCSCADCSLTSISELKLNFIYKIYVILFYAKSATCLIAESSNSNTIQMQISSFYKMLEFLTLLDIFFTCSRKVLQMKK